MKTAYILLSLSFVLLLNNGYRAQDNTAFDKGTIVATVGYGFPDLERATTRAGYSRYNSTKISGIGPLNLKGDYGIVKFKWGHSVGAGIVIGYSSTKVVFNDYYYNYGYYGMPIGYTETNNFKKITIGARGTYHFVNKEKLDCYASIGLGYNINSFSHTTNNPNGYSQNVIANSGVYTAFTVGIRYYFTKNIGVYSEVGWDMSAPIQAGLALKF